MSMKEGDRGPSKEWTGYYKTKPPLHHCFKNETLYSLKTDALVGETLPFVLGKNGGGNIPWFSVAK